MIAIIGAGISGLTLAYELQQRGVPYRLFDAGGEPGGVILSRREGAYLRELGPNSLLGDEALLAWIDQLGLTPELRFAKPVSKARYIYKNGAYRRLPSGPLSLLFGSYFSWSTKLAIWRERSNTTLSPPGETLSAFFRRRFSQEIVDYALGPFVAGIYAGDPDQLLVSETFPMLLDYEKEYGSVLKGFIKNAGTGRKQSFNFKDGMQTLAKGLAAQLDGLQLNDPVSQIICTETGWLVDAQSGSYAVEAVVLAAASDACASLLTLTYPDVAAALRWIHYPPMTAVHSLYKKADVAHPLDGFGGLNPRVEDRFAAGHIWTSSVFDDRCPADEVLLTTFVGGQQAADNARLSDEVIKQRVHEEIKQAYSVRAEAPVRQWVTRWERAIPQYDPAIVEAKQRIPALEADGLFVCANWYGGVSIADCIRKAKNLAVRLPEAIYNQA